MLVFGGPYSNLAATRALRAEAGRLAIPPNRIICTGDIVAYCAEPDETASLIREWGVHVVAGNCEEQLAEGADNCGCNFEEGTACDILARGWYPFANARVSAENRAWMAGLPRTLVFRLAGRRFRVIHGGVNETALWVWASQRAVLDEELAAAKADVVIAGHAGLPFIVERGRKVWFNAGVIGMPANDGTADGWYGLIEPHDGGIRLSTRRLSYDHATAAAAMRRYRYADSYARALITGLWPSLDVLPPAEQAMTGQRIRQRSIRFPDVGRQLLPAAAAAT